LEKGTRGGDGPETPNACYIHQGDLLIGSRYNGTKPPDPSDRGESSLRSVWSENSGSSNHPTIGHYL